MLASLLFPYDDDAPALIDGWLLELEHEGCIDRYVADGSAYVEIAKWLSHQKIDKPTPSKIPAFDSSSRILANPRESYPLDQGPEDQRIKDQGPEEEAPRKRSAPTQPIAKPDDVDQQTWTDWLSHRKAKRATVTETVVNGARAESEKAGMSLDAFLQVWCRRGSQGLEADWIKPNERQTQSRYQPNTETAHMRQRREVAQGLVPSIARRATETTDFIDMEQPNVPAIASH